MKFSASVATALTSLLAFTVSATPIGERDVPLIAIAFSNDQTGAYVRVERPAGAFTALNLLSGTPLQVYPVSGSAEYLASSVSLVGGFAYSPKCTLTSTEGGLTAQRINGVLNTQNTYLKLGDKTPEGLSKLQVVDLRSAVLDCTF